MNPDSTHSASPIVVASNRGPVSFVREPDGTIDARRGVGGLVTAVGAAVAGRDALWVAAAFTEEDRAQVDSFVLDRTERGALLVRLLDIEPALYAAYYNEFSNRILWFLHHDLHAHEHAPAPGARTGDAWNAYRAVNARFVETLIADAPEEATVLPQDYHLSLVPRSLRAARPDLTIGSFWHIPFCRPERFGILGAQVPELLEGMLGADQIGFHTEWWASNFIACCAEFLGAVTARDRVMYQGRRTRIGVYPIGVDVPGLQNDAARDEVDRAAAAIDVIAGDRTLILRVDRTELSKNILRGLVSYELLLERREDLRGRIVHLVMLTPSRGDVPEYQDYTDACIRQVDRVNERFGTPAWRPVVLEIDDDYTRALAAYRRYDVLLVNPVFDGMNLVAKEGPVLNERDGVLVLSANAGAAAELAPGALIVNPFDPHDTAGALERAVDMPGVERAERAAILRRLAPGMPPDRWLDRQLSDLSATRAF